MLPCAGLPNPTGVTPLVAANNWPGEMVRAFPGGVLRFLSTGFADSMVDVPGEHAAIVNSAVAPAAHQLLPNSMRMP
jgi:hypothetical protein